MSKKSQRRARAQAKKAAQAVQSPAKPKKVEFVARPFAGHGADHPRRHHDR